MPTPVSPPTVIPGSGSFIRARPLSHGVLVGERYRVQDRIAEGGMGAIYAALDESLGEQVAIKVLRPEMADDPRLRERFLNEARAAMSIAHENVVEIIDVGELPEGGFYYVMELMTGLCLAECDLDLELPAIVTMARALCRGLGAAHDKGVIHRDLKPENVFVLAGDEGPIYKLIDFGIAKLPFATALTLPGQVLGTPAYLAPEQARANAVVDHRSDIYALGVILYEQITGELPFDDEDPMRLILHHQFTAPRDIVKLEPSCPPKLARIVMKCLSKDPAQRFASAAALDAELAQALEPDGDLEPRLKTLLMVEDRGPYEAKTVIIRRDSATVIIPPTPPSRKVPWGLVLAAMAFGALVAGLVAWAL